MKKWADVRVGVTVMFDDEGEDDLHELAIEAAYMKLRGTWTDIATVEVIGPIRDTEEAK